MTKIRAILKIPGNRRSAKITSEDDSYTYFEGDEDQAARITFAIPAMVGGNYYAYYDGELEQYDRYMVFTISGFDTKIEVNFDRCYIQSMKVIWDDEVRNS